ncbi:hypothetical protein FIBSPDRAFT_877660 [Athelia psychrophila]|uniref:HPP transmembrane region domain-containing protein n=1 Tax=Athelia psychrophila TaxID=1759441 RepID=A0A167VT00_9AGAM|nr:hypothetical protein FIBSPDRAFT_877660 [Fibularhizoctonia sp. CBS 109695]
MPSMIPSLEKILFLQFPPAVMNLNFDIDKYLNPWIPGSPLHRLPRPVSRFLGYKDAPRQPIGNIMVAAWGCLGGFCGTVALSGLFMSGFIKDNGGPIMLGSYGAAAILEYNAIESPFSQPRNSIGGQVLGALVGVCITKLFALSAHFEALRWLAGALAVGVASAVSGLGWMYVPIVLLSSVVTTAVACLLNNIHRQYPIYWWSPREARIVGAIGDEEKKGAKEKDMDGDGEEERPGNTDMGDLAMGGIKTQGRGERIVICSSGITVPDHLYLSEEEREILQILEQRLRECSHRGHAEGNDDASTIHNE